MNTTYGALLNKYNDLFDPLMGRSVCITGQLFLLERSVPTEGHKVRVVARHIFVANNPIPALDYLKNKVQIGRLAGLSDVKAMGMTNAKLTAAMLKASKKPHDDERQYVYPENVLNIHIVESKVEVLEQRAVPALTAADDVVIDLFDFLWSEPGGNRFDDELVVVLGVSSTATTMLILPSGLLTFVRTTSRTRFKSDGWLVFPM